jgi:hypothetical protein
MKTNNPKFCSTAVFLSLLIQAHAQNTRVFNQNASRSNHTRLLATSDQWVFGINTGYSFGPNSNEQTLFRGNSIATKMSAAYYFGQIGLNFSGGIAPGSFNDNAISEFTNQRKYQQPIVTKSNPLNSYFLFGPAFRFGERIEVNADLQGGLFFNDPGGLSIRQQGIDRALYAFEGGQKNIFAGFGGSVNIGYPVNASSRFFISAEYLQSTSSIVLTDLQQGTAAATQQNRDIKLINIGIGIRKSFVNQKKEPAGSGYPGNAAYQPGARRQVVNVNDESNQMKHAINTKGTGATNGRMMNPENCGPVTMKTTNPDGTIVERTFSCPQDAENYINAVENPAENRMIHRDLAARNIISGRLTWVSPSNNDVGIITNNNIITAARQTQGTSFGEKVKIAIREAASGKNKALKQYGIILADQGNAYTSPLGSAKDNPSYQNRVTTINPFYQDNELAGENPLFESSAIHTNPLYQGNSNAGSNPMSESKNNMSGAQTNPIYSEKGIEENGLTGINVSLIDKETGQSVASTTTSGNGNFFFANVPDGVFIIKLSGAILRKEGFDLVAKSKIELLGKIQHGDEQIQLLLNTGEEGMEQRSVTSASRSDVRTRSINLVEADLDGDGQYEATRVMMELSDGSVQDVTASAKINNTSSVKKVTVRGWDAVKKQAATDNTQNEFSFSVNAAGQVSIADQEANGSIKNKPALTAINHQGNVSQMVVIVEGSGEPFALDDQKIKTKSNIKNDRMMSHSDHYTPQGISGYSKILNQAAVDIDGDGTAETLVSGALPGASVMPGAMMRPGQPIGGIVVKGGRNPGGNLRAVQTNENGEFEFNKLDAGNYVFLVEQKIIIEDESELVLESNAGARKGWDGTVKGGNIVSESSSKRKGWDGTVKGNRKEISEFLAVLTELDQLLTSDKKSLPGDIRITRENSARLRASVQRLENNPEAIQNGLNAVDTNFANLLASVNTLGSEYKTISNILKTRHDTAKNSVGNIR